MLHLILSMTLLSSPNEACKDPERAEHLCNTSYQLWDLTQKMDRELDVCKVKTFTLEKRLETVTATTVMHTKVIEVEKPPSALEKILEYAGATALVLGGFALGWVAFH